MRKRLLKLIMRALAILLGVAGGIALAVLLHYLQNEKEVESEGT